MYDRLGKENRNMKKYRFVYAFLLVGLLCGGSVHAQEEDMTIADGEMGDENNFVGFELGKVYKQN